MAEVIREKRIPHVTGREVHLVDGELSPDFDPAEGGRWVTLCTEHGEFVQHTSYRTARSFLADPREWCGACKKAPPVEWTGGFTPEDRARALEKRRETAARRAEAREAARQEKLRERTLEQQWLEWTFTAPMIDRLWDEEEELIAAGLRRTAVHALQAAQKARRDRRSAEEDVDSMPAKPKGKADQRLLKKLEDRVMELDQRETEKRAVAEDARADADRLARRAWIRGALQRGFTVTENGVGRIVAKGGWQARVPDDYLPAEDWKEVAA